MADIAIIFHWVPAVMDAMELSEIYEWRNRAIKRHNQINSTSDDTP